MNNAVKVLADEKIRLENIKTHALELLDKACDGLIVEAPVTGPDGNERLAKIIPVDSLTPEQEKLYQQYQVAGKKLREAQARLCLFNGFVKSLSPIEITQTYNNYVEPLKDYEDIDIPCSDIGLGPNGEEQSYSIRVGSYNIASSKEMTFEEYSELYSNSLYRLLIRTIAMDTPSQDVMTTLSNACAEIYLQSRSAEEIDEAIGVGTR